MFRMIIFFMIIAAIFGGRRERFHISRMLMGLFTFMAVMYGLRILFWTGFALLPCIIIAVLLGTVVVPFVKGFLSSFK